MVRDKVDISTPLAFKRSKVFTNYLIILFTHFTCEFLALYSHSNLVFKRISIKLLHVDFLRKLEHYLGSLDFRYHKEQISTVKGSINYFFQLVLFKRKKYWGFHIFGVCLMRKATKITIRRIQN